MVSRTIRIPSGSINITGTLTEADPIYRLLLKSLSQSGYKLAPPTKTASVEVGEDPLVTFLRHRLAEAEEYRDTETNYQYHQELRREIADLTRLVDFWKRAFRDLDELSAAALGVLLNREIDPEVRENIAIGYLEQ